MVTMENAEEYVELMFDFCMHTGIQKQMEAFRGECTHLTLTHLLETHIETSTGLENMLLFYCCFLFQCNLKCSHHEVFDCRV